MKTKTKIKDISELDLSKIYTYADYLTWWFEERVELFKGKIHNVGATPKRIHSEVRGNIVMALWKFIKENNYEFYTAPFDVRLNADQNLPHHEIYTVVQPDIVVICNKDILDDLGANGAPDLIVEILSPSTIKKDYTEKFNLYEENGVKEYWIANPEGRSLQIFHLENDKYIELETYEEKVEVISSKLFTDLKIEMTDVFEY